MKKLFLALFALFAFTARATATDIVIGASSITGFNSANAGADSALSNASVTLDSPSVTCSNCLPQSAVGLAGMKVSLGTPAVTYEIASVASRSAFTLTTNYTASTGTVSGTLHKFVHLRIYVTSPFVPSGSTTVVQSGSVGSTAWYRRYGVSIINDGAQNVAHVPAVNDLPATTDSSNPTATYVAGLWTQGGGFMQGYPGCVDEFRLSHLTSPTSWAQICQFNLPPTPPPTNPTTFLTEQQINARFPSCLANNLDFFAATGNVKSCLTLSSDFSITSGVLSVVGAVSRIQEEGSNLPFRNTLNFAGSSATAADDPGNARTNVTFDADLNALASNAANGFWAAGTNVARTILGTANRIVVTNGDGSVGNLTVDIGSLVATSSNNLSFFAPTTSAQLAGVISDETGSGSLVFGTSPSITTPVVSGGTFTTPTVTGSLTVAVGNPGIVLDNPAATNEATVFVSDGNIFTMGTAGVANFLTADLGTRRVTIPSGLTLSNTSPSTPLVFDNSISANEAVAFVNDSNIFTIGTNGVAGFLSADLGTRIVTFPEIPLLPAVNPTTANQAVRKQALDDTTTAWSASWVEADPSTATLSTADRATFFVPDGTEIKVTKTKITFQQGSHTSGGTLTYTFRYRNADASGLNDFGTATLDNTNNTINVTYTNDIGDLTLTAGGQITVFMTTRTGTISERAVSLGLVGTQKRIP